MTPRHKFSVGPFQGWLCGKQDWEVRHRDGLVMGKASNMMDCALLATRLNDEKKELFESFTEADLRLLSEIDILISAKNWVEADIVANKILKSIIEN